MRRGFRSLYKRLSDDEREKPHVSCALYRDRKRLLMGNRKASPAALHDTAVRIKKTLQDFDILVVDMLNIVL